MPGIWEGFQKTKMKIPTSQKILQNFYEITFPNLLKVFYLQLTKFSDCQVFTFFETLPDCLAYTNERSCLQLTFLFIFCNVRRPLDLSPVFPLQPFLVPALILAMSFLLSLELCLCARTLELTRFRWQLLHRTSPLEPFLHIKEFAILHAEHCGL